MDYPILSLIRFKSEYVLREEYESFPDFYLPGCLNEDIHVITKNEFDRRRSLYWTWRPQVIRGEDCSAGTWHLGHEAGHMIDFWRRQRYDILLNCTSFSKQTPENTTPSTRAAQAELDVSVYTQKLDEYLGRDCEEAFHFDKWKSSTMLRMIYRIMHGNEAWNEDRGKEESVEIVKEKTKDLVQNSQMLFDNTTPEEVYQSWKEVCAFLRPHHKESSQKHLTTVGS